MPSPTRRTLLNCEALDARVVPAALLDLTDRGDQAAAGGVLLRQADAVDADDLSSVVRLQDGDGTVRGYNTDARPQFDEARGRATRSLTLGEVPTVVVNGTAYREFVLDVNEDRRSAALSLDAVQIFVGNRSNLSGYNSRTNTLAGRTAAFDLDAGRDVSVVLNANLNRGRGAGDMTLLVPESRFAGAGADSYVYLYSEFGGVRGAREDGGAETWAVRTAVVAPPAPAPVATAGLSGRVYLSDGTAVSGVTVRLTGVNVLGEAVDVTATTDGDGAFTFAALYAGNYSLAVVPPAGHTAGQVFVGSIDGTGDGYLSATGDGQIDGIELGDGQTGTAYEFSLEVGGWE